MRIAIAVAALLLSGAANAREPVVLENLASSGGTATGTCGAASIKVSGIEDGGLRHGSGRVEVSNSGRTWVFQSGDDNLFLQDINYVACAKGASGDVLVVEAVCYARSCNPSDFTVIDVSSGKNLTPQTTGDGCDRDCAVKAIGGELPPDMRSRD